MVSDLTVLAIGFIAGFFSCLTTLLPYALERVVKPRPRAATEAKPKFSLRDFIVQKPAPEPKKSPIGAIPRSLGSWRNQKRELERQHNSKQKERDLRAASL